MSTQGAPDLAVLDMLADPVLAVDGEGRIVHWNPAAEQLYGYSRAEALGALAAELLETRFPAPVSEILDAVALAGHWFGTLVVRSKDGCELDVESHWALRRDADGGAAGAVAVDRLLARRAPAGRAPHRERRHGGERLRLVATTIAHDFNNVLAVIVNYAALIGREIDAVHEATGEQRWASLSGDIGEIRIAAQRGASLTRQLAAASGDWDAGSVESVGRPIPERRPGD